MSEKIYMGIDLGTSRSALVSNNGIEKVTLSVVGWPKDLIARQMLKQNLLFGRDALKHRLSLNVVYPLEKGVIKENEQEKTMAQELIKHLISAVEPPSGAKVYGIIGVPAKASVLNKQVVADIAKTVMDYAAVISEPFAVAYYAGRLDNAMIIDIGAGTVDICRMHGTVPEEEDQTTLYKAGDYIDKVFYDTLRSTYSTANFTLNMVREIKERHSFVHNVTRSVSAVFPVNGKPGVFDVTNELKSACESIVPEIVEAVKKLIATYDPEFQEMLRENVYLAGGGSQIEGLADMIAAGLADLGGAKVECIDDPLFAGAKGALKLAMDMPEEYWMD